MTIQQAELSQAMATGVIESYMSSGSTGYDTKTYENIKNFYDTQAWLPKNAVLVNQQGLRRARQADARPPLLKAAADAEARGWKVAQEEERRVQAPARPKSGMKIHKPSPKLDADMQQVGGIMQADWLKKAGPDGQAVVDAYKKNVGAACAASLDRLYDGAGALGAFCVFLIFVLMIVRAASAGSELARAAGINDVVAWLCAAAALLRDGPHVQARRLRARDAAARRRVARGCGARSTSPAC